MNYGDLIKIAMGALLIQNVILAKFLGICSFIGVSKKNNSAIGMGIAVIFVIVLSSTLTYFINQLILVPRDITFMRTIVFILVISGVVQFVEMFIKKTAPFIYKMLGIYLPLITTNCAVLGVALINVDPANNLNSYPKVLVYSIGIAAGYTMVIYVFSIIRERLELSKIPESFKGTPIAFITAGIMSLAFLGFSGLIN